MRKINSSENSLAEVPAKKFKRAFMDVLLYCSPAVFSETGPDEPPASVFVL